ncbi:unnamed protein product, partial [Mesorhabditis spiculigera]
MEKTCAYIPKNGWGLDSAPHKLFDISGLDLRPRDVVSLVTKTPNGEYAFPNIEDTYSSASSGGSPIKSFNGSSPLKSLNTSSLDMSTNQSPHKNGSVGSPRKTLFGPPLPTIYNQRLPSTPTSPIMEAPRDIFSRKVFVGGLPIDVRDADIYNRFSSFGKLVVDWPRQPAMKDQLPSRATTGYVFIVYEKEISVQYLMANCIAERNKFYITVSSPTMPNKPVQVRPWMLSDMDYVYSDDAPAYHSRTVFIGGVPRPSRAAEIAGAMQRAYGHVTYVGIDIDPELEYPKGAARITFATNQAYIAALRGKYVMIPHGDIQKRPYLMEEQICDECEGTLCEGRYASYFCGDADCLQYYCEMCWDVMHTPENDSENHKALVRIGEQTMQLQVPTHHENRNGHGHGHGHGMNSYKKHGNRGLDRTYNYGRHNGHYGSRAHRYPYPDA